MPSKCRIISDSTCDFTAQHAKERDVTIVPLHYSEPGKPDGGLHGDDDLFQSISAHDFYDAMRHGACPSTAQVSAYEYTQMFQECYDNGDAAVFFTLSSGISGTYECGANALEQFKAQHPDEEVRIYVVDSGVASTAFTLFLDGACDMRDAGLNAEQLVAWAEDAKFNVHTVFMVDNLEALHRGGRVPKSVAVVGDALDVKPILHFNLDGSLGICAVSRGRRKGLRKLIDTYERKHDDSYFGQRVCIGDADVPDDGYQVASELKSHYPDLQVSRPSIGPTIGCHVGPGMVSCCFWGADRRGEKQGGKVKGVREVKNPPASQK